MATWYENLGVVSIGAQCGGPDDGGLGEMKIELWKSLCKFCKDSHCAEVAHYALALRVGGEFNDYPVEGISRIRWSKKERVVGADITIPQAVWESKTEPELREYLAHRVYDALQMCADRLSRDNLDIDKTALMRQVESAVREFCRDS